LQSEGEWKIIFFVAGGIYLFGAVVYWFWAEGEVQPWAIPEDDDEGDREERKGNELRAGVSNPGLDIKE